MSRFETANHVPKPLISPHPSYANFCLGFTRSYIIKLFLQPSTMLCAQHFSARLATFATTSLVIIIYFFSFPSFRMYF
jgi:hypothetical protein